MQHTIKIASDLGVVPVMSVAAAMAYSAATLCDSPFHKPTYLGNLDGLLERLLSDVGSEVLPARDQYGRPGTQDEVIHRAKERGTYSEVLTADGSIDLAVTLGLCIYVSIPDLNRWGGATGDSFAIDSSGAEWVDERGVMKAGRQLVEGSAVAKVPAPPAGVDLEEGLEMGEEVPAVKIRPGRKPSIARDRLLNILEALELFASNRGEPFDRQAMPGPLGADWHEEGSFHWLCARISPAFKRAKSTFEKQRAGLCAVCQFTKPTDFYRKALPIIAPKLTGVSGAKELRR